MQTLAIALGLYCAGLAAQDTSIGQAVPATVDAPRGGLVNAVSIIHTNYAGQPSAQVPGLPGVEFINFDRPFASPNGNWILTATTTLPVAEDEVVLVNGAVVAREGTPTGVPGPVENAGLIDTRVFINDAGEWVYATSTDAATAVDEVIIKVSGGVPGIAAREGDPVPGIASATYGPNLNSPVIASDGRVGLALVQTGGVPAAQARAVVLGASVLAQSGVTIPSNQIAAEFWENFDLEDYWISADGGHWLAQGDLAGAVATDDVVVVDGAVVVQEGVALAGSGFVEVVDLNGIIGVSMAPDGRWFVRGNNAGTETDWVYSNGAVLAAVGGAVAGNPGELWSDAEFADCYFMHVGDSSGNYVIGGVTNAPTASNGVLVLNDMAVIAREGDPIDLDANGTFDDDAFFNTFGNDDGALDDDGFFYFTATIRNAAGTSTGSGFFMIDTLYGDRIFTDGFDAP